MVNPSHLAISFFLVVILPALADYLVSLVRLVSLAPGKNAISAANGQSLKKFFKGTFKGRKVCALEKYVRYSLLFTLNLTAFTLITAGWEGNARPEKTVLQFYFFYIAFTYCLRFYGFALTEGRLNFSKAMKKLSFSFTAMLVFFAGISYFTRANELGFGEPLLFLGLQFLLFSSFGVSLEQNSPKTFFETRCEAANRMSINLLTLSMFVLPSILTTSAETFLGIVSICLLLEIIMRLLTFENLKWSPSVAEATEKFTLLLLATYFGVEALS